MLLLYPQRLARVNRETARMSDVGDSDTQLDLDGPGSARVVYGDCRCASLRRAFILVEGFWMDETNNGAPACSSVVLRPAQPRDDRRDPADSRTLMAV
jgi:hypothetical protein